MFVGILELGLTLLYTICAHALLIWFSAT